jgi:hypothetical protein
VRFIFRNVLNYGYFRTGSVSTIVQKALLRWVKAKGRILEVKVKIAAEKVDVLYKRRNNEMLLLYGDKTEEFDAVNGEGSEHVIEKKAIKVFHRIYLSLQEDEVELANPLFDIFNDLINYLQ